MIATHLGIVVAGVTIPARGTHSVGGIYSSADQPGTQHTGTHITKALHTTGRPNIGHCQHAGVVGVTVVRGTPVLGPVVSGHANHHHTFAITTLLDRSFYGLFLKHHHIKLR